MIKPPLHFIGMYGIGDNLHQRSVIVQLMEHYDVWLETCHVWIYHDLLAKGLKLILRPTALWMHAQNIEQEKAKHPGIYRDLREVPKRARTIRNWYHKHEIDKHGSILETMHAICGTQAKGCDFRVPLLPEWRERARAVLAAVRRDDPRPLMIYRPIVLRKEWDGKLRNPLPDAYAELYVEARRDFFTLSIASLRPGIEWIIGEEQAADFKIHDGSLEMWVMAAVFAEADMVFCNAGMAPVLAQSMGVPSVVVYGGRESFKTTQRAGAHLAPTLGVDVINPCDCHSHTHNCDKRIDVPNAKIKIREFIDAHSTFRNNIRRHVGETCDSEHVVQNESTQPVL